MNFEIYNEESHIINNSEYRHICERLHKEGRKIIHADQRKIYFNEDINYLVDVSSQEHKNTDQFSINIFEGRPDCLILDKRSNREGTIYRQYTYLTVSDCQRILAGDIGWLINSDKAILRDLYWQLTMNLCRPGVIVDYERTKYAMGGGDYLIFDTAINSTYDFEVEKAGESLLLKKDILMEPRLEPGNIVMTYRQELGVPKVLTRVLDRGYNVVANNHV